MRIETLCNEIAPLIPHSSLSLFRVQSCSIVVITRPSSCGEYDADISFFTSLYPTYFALLNRLFKRFLDMNLCTILKPMETLISLPHLPNRTLSRMLLFTPCLPCWLPSFKTVTFFSVPCVFFCYAHPTSATTLFLPPRSWIPPVAATLHLPLTPSPFEYTRR